MPVKEKLLLEKLQQISNKYEPEVLFEKTNLLKQLSNLKKISASCLIAYHDTLLFLLAYPANKQQLLLTQQAFKKLSLQLRKLSASQKSALLNSGLPHTPYRSRFSHDMVKWLLSHPDCSLQLHNIANDWFDLNEVLKLTLPSLEKSETTAGMENEMLRSYFRGCFFKQKKASRNSDWLLLIIAFVYFCITSFCVERIPPPLMCN